MAGFPWFFPHERFLQFETPGWSGSTQNRLGLTYPTEVRGGGGVFFYWENWKKLKMLGFFLVPQWTMEPPQPPPPPPPPPPPTTTTTTTATTTTATRRRRRRRYYNKHLVVWTADFTKDNHNNNSSVFEWCIFLVAQMTLTLSGQVINLWESPPKTSAVLRSFFNFSLWPRSATGGHWISMTFGWCVSHVWRYLD